MNKDVQGVTRGKCTQCSCSGYFGGEKKLKCKRPGCGHPPVKHENMEELHKRHEPQIPCGPQPKLYSQAAQPHHQTQAIGHHQAYVGHGSAVHSTYTQHRVSTPPACKVRGCSQEAHHDPTEPGIGWFDYCSPQCRDKDLLEKSNRKLESDLQDLVKDIQKSPSPKKKTSGSKANKGNGPQVPQQTTRDIFFQKPPDQGLGLMFYSRIYTLESVKGFLVTGVRIVSSGCEMVKNSELRFLSIITRVNGKPPESIASLGEELKRCGTASLITDGRISLGCSPSLLTRNVKNATHVIVLMNPHSFKQKTFGFEYCYIRGTEGLRVTSVEKHKIARQSGLEFGDVILKCATCTNDSMDRVSDVVGEYTFKTKLDEAVSQGKNVALFIKRTTL